MVEALVITLIGTIIAMFGVQMFLSRPEYGPALRNLFIPSARSSPIPTMLYIAIGMLGATVMPHNLYLHSSIVQSRKLQAHAGGQARSHLHGQRGFGAGADRGAVCECGDCGGGGGGVLSQRAL
jgi:NRAMP (natural resistance-associated macrophage protein)-like metal ion transporter